MENLKTICHFDGRNFSKIKPLTKYFSEYSLIKYRLLVEIRYLQKLTGSFKNLDLLINNFNEKEAHKITEIEKKINHDVKAVEYYLRQKVKSEMVHFAVTSEDINNLAYALLNKDALEKEFLPYLKKLINEISSRASNYKSISMLARTHGQPASPTSLGKELAVFSHRLDEEYKILKNLKLAGKLSGASGNYNSFVFVKPQKNWQKFSRNFVQDLGLVWESTTTQIAPYEPYIRIFDSIKRTNNILLDMVIDLWYYISLGYFKQKKIRHEVGSSVMPHKINPIAFEAAEGNLGLSNTLFEYFARKLPLNRMQRDLSDSTIRRNFGLAFAYSYFAYDSIFDGLSRIIPNKNVIDNDLEKHYEVLTEGVQTYLRSKGYKKPYEKLKLVSRGKTMDKNDYQTLVKNLRLKKKDEAFLIKLEPKKYLGYSINF